IRAGKVRWIIRSTSRNGSISRNSKNADDPAAGNDFPQRGPERSVLAAGQGHEERKVTEERFDAFLFEDGKLLHHPGKWGHGRADQEVGDALVGTHDAGE